jgi:DNA topoisomerase-1
MAIKEELTKTEEVCELCGKPMVIRWGRYGKFLACSGYPECKNLKSLDRKDNPSLENTDEKCPTCGAGLVIRNGRFGRFLACSKYPKCKFTKALGTGLKCPRPGCGGELIEKRTKSKRIFFSCSNYPTCKITSWQKPIPVRCSKCGEALATPNRSRGRLNFGVCLVCGGEIEISE